MKTTNGWLAVIPPESRSAKVTISGGLATVGHYKELLGMKVCWDSDKYKSNQTVYTQGDIKYLIYTFGDIKYALIPESAIIAYE